MVKRHRSFAPKGKKSLEPLDFDLLDGEFSFTCKPAIQGTLILEFVSSTGGETADAATHLVDFIRESLIDDDEIMKFDAVVYSEDPAHVIDIEDLGEIVSWLIEEYTTRPTKAS